MKKSYAAGELVATELRSWIWFALQVDPTDLHFSSHDSPSAARNQPVFPASGVGVGLVSDGHSA
eukprot:CAMPEP_0185849744 /NCGR_PEP_ID=MMETSP1354-20130828/4153_1 /TAXON_ID=708628 /ORGANISM="Erythrolobus madagascarensis, Strain CCMP3276" /LENGTH=63 /DNA_ID=CAMNT_0028550341 /DNA_START=285 /DNA_END=476 /DNA_ORIENTATION=+